MGRSKNWDMYETALLIECVEKINSDNTVRAHELHALSETLRNRAKNLGIDYDERFRNYNGMVLQAIAIESLLYSNRTPRHCAKIFKEMTEVWKYNREKYQAILTEALKQSKTDY